MSESATEPVSLTIDMDVAPQFEDDVDGLMLEEVLSRAVAEAGLSGSVEVSVVITENAEIHELNRQYRGVDAPTDVLSFSQIEGTADAPDFPVGGVRQLGDIVISGDKVRAQAEEYGHSRRRELAYLAVHGLLHLLGFDHETPEDQAEMRQAEENALVAYPRQ